MHPRTQEVIDHLDAAREDLRRAIEEVPADLRQQRPAPDRWSVAEILEHLVIVETRVTGLIAGKITAAKAEGLARETDEGSVLETFNLAGLSDRSRRLTAGAASQPPGAATSAAAWSALVETRALLKLAVLSGDGWALETLSQPHPALGPLNLYQWMAFVGSHEARHAAQIREVGESLARPIP